ncbi:MAG: hypothetical protein ACI4R8_01625 [Candidatus Caccovivens sp.]
MERINELLIRDKFTNLEQIAEVLKGEVTTIARNFFLLDDDLVVRYRREGDKFVFNVEISATRIKPFGNMI